MPCGPEGGSTMEQDIDKLDMGNSLEMHGLSSECKIDNEIREVEQQLVDVHELGDWWCWHRHEEDHIVEGSDEFDIIQSNNVSGNNGSERVDEHIKWEKVNLCREVMAKGYPNAWGGKNPSGVRLEY